MLSDMKIRLPVALKAWLAHEAASNNRSLNAELVASLDKAARANPLKIVVRYVDLGPDGLCISKGPFYAVSEGEFGDDFHEGTDKKAAVTAAMQRVKELGLPIQALELRVETPHTATFGDIVSELPNIEREAA